jgi:hypothetical protein
MRPWTANFDATGPSVRVRAVGQHRSWLDSSSCEFPVNATGHAGAFMTFPKDFVEIGTFASRVALEVAVVVPPELSRGLLQDI